MSVAREIEKTLFEAARELADPALRAVFLDQVCTGQPALRRRLDRLLAMQAPADEFFRAVPVREPGAAAAITPPPAPGPPASPPPNGEAVNTLIGRYRLLQRLGEGGCGVVYLAEQQEPVRRRLALKIIRLGMDTESVIARFKAEQQALALMDHPNIAHVIDAEATDSGRPYFVMELVQGVKITDYCNQNNLGVPPRLQLFIQVCHAIQHAHQKGVIHRDIKPSNILVAQHDGAPVPKVIDFGIAKATAGRLADNTLYTAYDQFVGTPAYMSPEQANGSGLDVDTRSDVYSLGVLLYELLTGRTPFDSHELVKSGMDELRRTLLEREPQLPSTLLTTLGHTELRAVALQHRAEPLRLISALRGDLDWIVMKALEKDRRRRYETANGLAMDVQRYLDNEPVIARPPSSFYRLQKLVRRNKVVFAAIAAVTLALLLGLGLSTWLLLQEREARERAVAAERQQIRLREEADRLRQQAESRVKLAQAIVPITRNDFEEADRLVMSIPAPSPDLEFADVYRVLGDWHAAHGRWQTALERFAPLLQMKQPEDWDVATLDYLRYGPALLEAGNTSGYEEFRRAAVAHFAGTTNPVPAERVLKVSLLTPPGARLLASLVPLAATASNSLAGVSLTDGRQKSLAAWRSFSLALMDFRRGNYPGLKQWHQKSAAYETGIPVRELTFQIMEAMAHYQAGDPEQARSELWRVKATVDQECDKMPLGESGYWFDWIFARILLREATAMMSGAHP